MEFELIKNTLITNYRLNTDVINVIKRWIRVINLENNQDVIDDSFLNPFKIIYDIRVGLGSVNITASPYWIVNSAILSNQEYVLLHQFINDVIIHKPNHNAVDIYKNKNGEVTLYVSTLEGNTKGNPKGHHVRLISINDDTPSKLVNTNDFRYMCLFGSYSFRWLVNNVEVRMYLKLKDIVPLQPITQIIYKHLDKLIAWAQAMDLPTNEVFDEDDD